MASIRRPRVTARAGGTMADRSRPVCPIPAAACCRLKRARRHTRERLADMGWKIAPARTFDSGYGGYQCIMKGAEAYGAATEMRKDGLALAY
jgi:hypothetical protein